MYRDYIRGYTGIMAKKMETTITGCWGFQESGALVGSSYNEDYAALGSLCAPIYLQTRNELSHCLNS